MNVLSVVGCSVDREVGVVMWSLASSVAVVDVVSPTDGRRRRQSVDVSVVRLRRPRHRRSRRGRWWWESPELPEACYRGEELCFRG